MITALAIAAIVLALAALSSDKGTTSMGFFAIGAALVVALRFIP